MLKKKSIGRKVIAAIAVGSMKTVKVVKDVSKNVNKQVLRSPTYALHTWDSRWRHPEQGYLGEAVSESMNEGKGGL